MRKTVEHHVRDLLDYIERIKNATLNVKEEEFSKNIILQDALLREIEVVGEIVKKIPQHYRDRYPHVPWLKIAGTRDIVAHDYDGVDLSAIWLIAKRDIISLEEEVLKMITDSDFEYET
jgi:uncharacterized protein with HEPN domain